MRVFPFGRATGEKEYRPRLREKIASHVPVAPPAVERSRPAVATDAYTVLGLVGSNLTSLTEPARVPRRMWLALPGSIAIQAIERLFVMGNEPCTSDQ